MVGQVRSQEGQLTSAHGGAPQNGVDTRERVREAIFRIMDRVKNGNELISYAALGVNLLFGVRSLVVSPSDADFNGIFMLNGFFAVSAFACRLSVDRLIMRLKRLGN